MKNKIKFLGVLVISLFLMPINTLAEEMSEGFREMLNKDGELEVKTIRPTTDNEAMILLSDYLYATTEKIFIDPVTCNDDYTKCELSYNPGWTLDQTEKHEVDIIYNYDESIKRIIDGYSSRIPEDLEYFEVRDMELINFWVNGKGDVETLINYSSHLKEYLDYKNFIIDLRMGNDAPFLTMASGIANFTYDGVLYGARLGTGVRAKHIIFVDEETGNTKEELAEAAQNRIDEYVGEGKVEVQYKGEDLYHYFVDMYDEEIQKYQNILDAEMAKPENEQDYATLMDSKFWVEQYNEYKEYFIESYNSEDGENAFLKDAEGDYYFSATIKDGNEEKEYLFIIVKDSNSMIKPTYKTSDLGTDVTITSEASSIPLDTLVQVEKLTSGEEYEKIIKVLNNINIESFDVNLYSKSLEDYIRKLEDGTFEVKIPISEKFKGKEKNLVVYYISDDGKIEPFTVETKDGYAVFTTNHFSTYTLATTNDVLPPKTGDGITTYFIIGLISMLGLAAVALYIKKQNN